MEQPPLFRKYTVIGIILLLVGIAYAPAMAQYAEKSSFSVLRDSLQENDVISYVPIGDSFGLYSNILVSWDANQTTQPLDPSGTPRIVTINIAYNVLKGLFGRVILFYSILKKQTINMTIEIVDKPAFCTATISNSSLRFPISEILSVQRTNLTVSVNEYAPAYVPFFVKMKASVGTVFGPLDFLPFIHGFEQNYTLYLIPGHLFRIIVTPASDFMNVTPGNSSHLPINITNKGNAVTLVYTDIVDFPSGDWSFAITDLIKVEVNTSNFAFFVVRPPNNFTGTENITISFTPHLINNPTQHGDPVYITIIVQTI